MAVCGAGSVPVYIVGDPGVTPGNELVGDRRFAGCYSVDESWIQPFLDNTGKFATLPADDPAVANTRIISTETTKALKAWNELLARYEAGEATLRELLDFDASALEGNETWKEKYDELIATESQAPRTWEEIEEILRRNGYSDDEIQEVKDSIRPPGGEFQGSLVLPGILSDLGYEGGEWWDVRPVAGTPCDANGFFGEYDADGECVSKGIEGKAGDPCGNGGTRDAYGVCQGETEDTGDGGAEEGTGDEAVDCGQNPDHPDCKQATIEDLIGEFGEAAVSTAQEVYDYIEDKIGEIKEDPLGVLREILTGGVLSGDERCWEGDMQSCDTADPDKGDICWKDCVNIVGVLGIPGIPLPPGIGDFGTVRDLEDFLKGIGKDIGEFIEDPAGSIEGWIESIIDKIKGVFDSTTDDASAIVDWLKGIFGASVGAWVWGQIEEEVTDTVFPNLQPYGMCPDGETPKQGPSNEGCPAPAFECSSVGKRGGTVYREEQCTGCLSTHQEKDGQCVEWLDEGDTEEDCAAQNREFVPSTGVGTNSKCGGCLSEFQPNEDGDCVPKIIECTGNQVYNESLGECEDPPPDCTVDGPCTDDSGASGTFDENCDCIATWINSGPSAEDCSALGKTHIPADSNTKAPSECGDCEQQGWTPTGPNGECEAPWQDSGPTPEDCSALGKLHIPGDSETQTPSQCGGCEQEGWTSEGLGKPCTEPVKPWENTGPTEEDCSNQGKTFIPADPESQTPSSCGDNIQLPWEDTGKTPEQCEAEGKLFIAGDAETQTPSSCGPCLKNGYIDYGDGCVPERGTGEETDEGAGELTECEKDPESYECLGADEFCSRPENKNDQRCKTIVVEPPVDGEGEIDPCEDPAYASANPVECGVETGPSPCDQQDRVTNEDGSCGECKPGFIEDPEGFDQCIKAPPECNDCSCAEYAASNPQECGEVPPTETGGGGGGGVGGGAFTAEAPEISMGIQGDPTLLAGRSFPITDYLAGLFTGTGGGRA